MQVRRRWCCSSTDGAPRLSLTCRMRPMQPVSITCSIVLCSHYLPSRINSKLTSSSKKRAFQSAFAVKRHKHWEWTFTLSRIAGSPKAMRNLRFNPSSIFCATTLARASLTLHDQQDPQYAQSHSSLAPTTRYCST